MGHGVAVPGCFLGVLCSFLLAAPLARGADEKSVVPFDFTSRFDGGTLGRQLGDMVWAKLNRQRGFVIPESMHDVRDFCQSKQLLLDADTDLAKVRRAVVEEFSSQIGIWGRIERAPGHTAEIYDLTIKCYDFSVVPPRKIFDHTARTNSAAEVPHVYVKQLLDALYERSPAATSSGPDPGAEANWQRQRNLLPNGNFERGSGGVPAGWDSVGGQQREPLGKLVRWVDEPGANPPNKVLRLAMDRALGDSFGVMYYSQPFPVDHGATYRLQFRWRSNGPEAKVFVKVYAEMPTTYGQPADAREVYRSQQNCKGPRNQWNVHSEDFTPQHTKYDLKSGRIELFGYHGAGVVEFDDFVLRQIVAASPSELVRPRRHSSATRVTLKEMEANERRSREASRSDQEQSTPPLPLRRRTPD
jgi:hypothetical protein